MLGGGRPTGRTLWIWLPGRDDGWPLWRRTFKRLRTSGTESSLSNQHVDHARGGGYMCGCDAAGTD